MDLNHRPSGPEDCAHEESVSCTECDGILRCATKELPKEEFKREVDRYLTGKESEPWEIIYFKLYKGQLATVERALEIAAFMLGSDTSRGYSLEMICAKFLAGAAIEMGNLDAPASTSRSIDEEPSTNA